MLYAGRSNEAPSSEIARQADKQQHQFINFCVIRLNVLLQLKSIEFHQVFAHEQTLERENEKLKATCHESYETSKQHYSEKFPTFNLCFKMFMISIKFNRN